MTPLPLPAGSPLWRRVFARALPTLDAAIEQQSGETRLLLELINGSTPLSVHGTIDDNGDVMVRLGIPIVGWGGISAG